MILVMQAILGKLLHLLVLLAEQQSILRRGVVNLSFVVCLVDL